MAVPSAVVTELPDPRQKPVRVYLASLQFPYIHSTLPTPLAFALTHRQFAKPCWIDEFVRIRECCREERPRASSGGDPDHGLYMTRRKACTKSQYRPRDRPAFW